MMVWLAPRELVENRVAVQRHHPADLQLVGGDALFGEKLDRLVDDAFGRPPADQRDVGVARADELRRWDGGLDAGDLALALLHHGAALDAGW